MKKRGEFFTELEKILDEHFPKGQCQERGGALMLFSWANILHDKLVAQALAEGGKCTHGAEPRDAAACPLCTFNPPEREDGSRIVAAPQRECCENCGRSPYSLTYYHCLNKDCPCHTPKEEEACPNSPDCPHNMPCPVHSRPPIEPIEELDMGKADGAACLNDLWPLEDKINELIRAFNTLRAGDNVKR